MKNSPSNLYRARWHLEQSAPGHLVRVRPQVRGHAERANAGARSPAWRYFIVAYSMRLPSAEIPDAYWDHVRRKMEEMEKRWLQTGRSGLTTDVVPAEPHRRK